MTRRRGVLLALAVAAGASARAAAQVPERGALRGAVVGSDNGERLGYALVILDPLHVQRFAEADGSFIIPDLEAGSYRLMVRQVGYRPFDSTVTISVATPPLRIELVRVAVELPAISVPVVATCRAPGVPDPGAQPELAAIFDQLKLNAQRHALLLDQYPFRYTIEREQKDGLAYGNQEPMLDTLSFDSDGRWPYRPGRVVTDDPDHGRNRIAHFPLLADFADSLFHVTHCFRLAGLDTLRGEYLVRLDFQAAESLRDPDFNGSVYLDPSSYQVRHTRYVMTRLPRAGRDITSWTALASFREIVPNLILVERVEVQTIFQEDVRLRNPRLNHLERQHLLRVDFLRRSLGPPGRVP